MNGSRFLPRRFSGMPLPALLSRWGTLVLAWTMAVSLGHVGGQVTQAHPGASSAPLAGDCLPPVKILSPDGTAVVYESPAICP